MPVPDNHDLAARISHTLATRPEALMLDFEGREWLRSDFARLARKLEDKLSATLPSKDCVVGLVIRNRPMHVGMLWALIAAGRTVSVINPFRDAKVIAEEVAGQRFPVLIADKADWEGAALREAALATGTLGVQIGEEVADSAGFIDDRTLLDESAYRARLPGVAVEMLTGGTSGSPKRFPLT